MTRVPREISPTGAYHIMVRGINKQEILMSSDEKTEYLQRLFFLKQEYLILLCAYAIMDNHAHFLLIEQGDEAALAKLMLRLNSGYASWYNHRHGRIGTLFQERYCSEVIHNDSQLLTVVRYIHQNPVKIGRSVSYWTSYNDYLNDSGITDTELVLSMFSPEQAIARKRFSEFVEEENELQVSFDEQKRLRNTDKKIIDIAESIVGKGKVRSLIYLDTENRNEQLKRLKKSGLTVRQIEKTTGISKSVVSRA